ncbi:MAG: tRNA (N(6)-L-threonylcarbamoyladenosine(37)-C(2))-methylthiotransferase [Nitrososphaerota archaeon]
MPRIYIESYGCSANLQDSQIMMGLLLKAGYELASTPIDADALIINTCIVKTPTEHRMIHRIRQLSSTHKPLIVAGCMTKTEPEVVRRINPTASLIGPNSIDQVVDVVNQAIRGITVEALMDSLTEKSGLPHVRLNPVIDIVEISSGCLLNCSFCQTKLARGNLRSYRPESIRKQIETAVRDGCREIWLTSQDNSAYGLDIGTNIAELLSDICKNIDGDFLIRVGMMNPLHLIKGLLRELINAYNDRRIFKFLHLCIQSGSDKVLRDMRRGYTVSNFYECVKMFRETYPDLTLMTDIIVGYPTEDEQDFEASVKLLTEVKPDFVNISRFYPRPGTPAAKLKPLPVKTLNERSKLLTELCREIALKKNEKWIGWEGPALIDELGEHGELIGRNINYRPIVINNAEKSLLGRLVNVHVTEARPYCLLGKIKSIIN